MVQVVERKSLKVSRNEELNGGDRLLFAYTFYGTSVLSLE